MTAARGLKSDAEVVTHVEGLSALLMEMVDLDDPVEVGADTAYEIRVTNTGSKTETNLQLVCTIPDKMEFRNAVGAAGVRQPLARQGTDLRGRFRNWPREPTPSSASTSAAWRRATCVPSPHHRRRLDRACAQGREHEGLRRRCDQVSRSATRCSKPTGPRDLPIARAHCDFSRSRTVGKTSRPNPTDHFVQ